MSQRQNMVFGAELFIVSHSFQAVLHLSNESCAGCCLNSISVVLISDQIPVTVFSFVFLFVFIYMNCWSILPCFHVGIVVLNV
jgi:hypothetical protein